MKKHLRWASRKPWTSDEITVLRKNHHLTAAELVRFFTRRTIQNILDKKRELGLVVNNIILQDLTNLEYQIILGSMLGDGYIQRTVKAFGEAHSVAQADYLYWKRRILKRLHPGRVTYYRRLHGPSTDLLSFRIGHTYTLWDQLYSEFYDYNGTCWHKTYIPQHVIDRLDRFGLLIWFLDDGCAGGKIINWSIAVKSWNRETLAALVQSLNCRLNLHLYIYDAPTTNIPSLKIPAQDRHVLLPIWRRIFKKYKMPKCMRYKLRGTLDHNRWTRKEISILSNNLHLPPKELQLLLPSRTKQAIYTKKSKLKAAGILGPMGTQVAP